MGWIDAGRIFPALCGYAVEAANEALTLKTLHDQFGVSEGVKIGNLLFLCAPTAKNGVAPRDRVTQEGPGYQPVHQGDGD